MNISTKSRYALRALIYILKNRRKYVTVKQISLAEGVSSEYLEKILLSLKKNNIVDVKKGVNGGFFLAKDPKKITIYDIVYSLEKSKLPDCLQDTGCNKSHICLASKVWRVLEKKYIDLLKSLKLSDVLNL